MKHSLVIYTDGACSGNPGPGGWGAVLLYPQGRVKELGGGQRRTTNNRMELSAAIEALKAARAFQGPVRLYTDSTYVIHGVTSWLKGWKRRGWLRADGQEVLNRDLWEALEALAEARAPGLTWHYVRGHQGDCGNERCDDIAVTISKGKHPALYEGPLSGYRIDLSFLPADQALPKTDFSRGARKKAGGVYLSLLEGRLERHATWADCQARVHGKPARFKKVSGPDEEAAALRSWGLA
jgi:ribonuclease HI